jgi:hypothetical protein
MGLGNNIEELTSKCSYWDENNHILFLFPPEVHYMWALILNENDVNSNSSWTGTLVALLPCGTTKLTI